MPMIRLATACALALCLAAAPVSAAEEKPLADSMGPEAPGQGALAQALLRAVPAFAVLSDAAIAALADQAEPRLVRAGDPVIVQGATDDSLMLLAAGDFAVLIEGTPAPVARLEAGEIVGEYALLTGAARSATIRAVADGLVFVLTRDTLAPTLRAHPAVVTAMAGLMAERIQRNSPQGPSRDDIARDLEAQGKARLGL